MCYPMQCPVCGKTGWAGCGQHVNEGHGLRAACQAVHVPER